MFLLVEFHMDALTGVLETLQTYGQPIKENPESTLAIPPTVLSEAQINERVRATLLEIASGNFEPSVSRPDMEDSIRRLLEANTQVIDLSSLSYEDFVLYESLMSTLSSEECAPFLPSEIPYTLSWYGRDLLSYLIDDHYFPIENRLPYVLDLSCNNPVFYDFLSDLLQVNRAAIVARIPNPIDLSQTSREAIYFLRKLPLILLKVCSWIPDTPNFDNFSAFLQSADQILLSAHVALIPRQFDLATMTQDQYFHAATVLSTNRDAFIRDVLPRVPTTAGYMSGPAVQFIQDIKDDEMGNSFSALDADPQRVAVPYTQLSIVGKAGPYLHESIQQFPIRGGTIKQLPDSWIRAELDKSGSRTMVYMRIVDGDIEVVFRNRKIDIDSQQALQKATEILPGYVSSDMYPELQSEQPPLAKFYGDGFREVYAGPSLSTLHLDLLPPDLAASIQRQKTYVLKILEDNNIIHDHPHNGNFNVRFLLSKGTEKKLFFDVNAALQHAIKHKMDITPIVTLRDWDSASS